jgi:large subunit ribosomal protein L21
MAATKATTKKTAAKKAPKKAAPKAAAKRAAEGPEFAVIETGGKQYMVAVGDVLDVELLGAHEEGDKIEFDKVLMVDDGKDATIGTPYIKGATVKATFQGETKGKKISIIRYKAKSNRDRKVGHRQHYARVQIDAI